MEWVWTWGGESFGYLDDGDLWTHDGKHVGRLDADKHIYSPNGAYIGEVANENRLIVNSAKTSWRGPSFNPWARRVGYVKYVNYVGYVMYVGHKDFPKPDTFK